ncbi:carboxypeptidase-like regulatory domain-containing protein [Puia sp. P3]|uniref:carboxypeptidase-like regulatory domain-containing protein n=1 Tax=Puia sp. P3 TaxID=3423952 RepID=UPI003D67D6DF
MGYGQTRTITGRIKCSEQEKYVSLVAVTLLNSDSSLVLFTRTDNLGKFRLSGEVPAGHFLLFLSHPSYSILYQSIAINSDSPTDLGELLLKPRIDSLPPVIVSGPSGRPRVKRDTIEFNTENVHVRANAVVDELLGRLPGLHVDLNGNITYNGQRIEKLLVDGEDLFGSDPSIVTRNFDADRIARVQILDRKSDRTTFTGVDDGSRTKTLNLVLKENSRDTYFGNADAGRNLQGIYDANDLIASLHNKEQFTALAMATNTGTVGFSSDVAGTSARAGILSWKGDDLGTSAGKGIPHFIATGLHYANTWDRSEGHINGNYQYGHLYTNPNATNIITQILPDTLYVQNQSNRSFNAQNQHYFDLLYDFDPDTLSSFKLSANGNTVTGNNIFNSSTNSSFNNKTVNGNLRSINSSVNHDNYSGTVYWRLRSKVNPSRVFSIISSLRKTENLTDAKLYTLDYYYTPTGSILRQDTVDQQKHLSNNQTDASGIVNFTTPIFKNVVAAMSYILTYEKAGNSQITFAKSNGKYIIPVDSLNSRFKEETYDHQLTTNIQGKTRRLEYIAGADLLSHSYHRGGPSGRNISALPLSFIFSAYDSKV